MDEELKTYLESMKRDMRELREHVTVECEKVETKVREHVSVECDKIETKLLTELREHVSIECEKVETKLLTEFHKWASPAEARAKSHAAALRAMDLELEAISERVTKLEPTH